MRASSSDSRWRTRLGVALPALLALALMVPRIVRADFGLFDDPTSLQVANQISQGQWGLGSDVGFGRFRPMFWLQFAACYLVAGKSPSLYFIGNAVILALTALLLALLAQRLTRSSLAALLSGMAYVLGGPVVENAYTLSKPELLQTLFLVAAVLAATWGSRSRWHEALTLGLGTILALLACGTKETAGLLLPISMILWVRAWIWRAGSRTDQASQLSARGRLVSAAGMAVVLAVLVARSTTPGLFAAAGPRANFGLDPRVLIGNARAWGDWLARDYLYVVPLGLAWLLGAAWSHRARDFRILLDCAVWSGMWLLVYLPYRFTPEYYLLPLSVGVSLAVGVLVHGVQETLADASMARRAIAAMLLGAGSALFLLTLPTNASNAGVQLSVDNANADMIDMVSEKLPDRATVLVNIQEMNEYVWAIGPMLSMMGDRADLVVDQYTFPLSEDLQARPDLFVVSPIIENQPYPTVRLGVHEHNARAWEASLDADLGSRLVLLGEVRSSTPLLMVDSLRLFCVALPRAAYCQVPNAPFETRRFAAGWRLYAVRPAQR
jgi:hypothetical protein